MEKWIPEGMVLLGSLLGGLSLFLQESGGTDVPVADEFPGESSISSDCGAISLYMICRISGISTSLEEMRKLTKTSVVGTSLFDIKEAAEQQGFTARGARCSFDFLWDYVAGQGHYAILYFKSGHFAPAVHIAESKVIILDTRGLEMKECSAADLKTLGWDDTALLLQKQES